jgi:hypothetical protein
VVEETENFSFGQDAITLRMIVDFPTPEGADTMKSCPVVAGGGIDLSQGIGILELLYQVGFFGVSVQKKPLGNGFGLNAGQDYVVAVGNNY